MAVVHKIARFAERTKFLNRSYYNANQNESLRSFCTMVQQPKTLNLVRVSVMGAITGVTVGAGYAYYKINEARKNISLEGAQAETVLLEHKPSIAPSRKVFLMIMS